MWQERTLVGFGSDCGCTERLDQSSVIDQQCLYRNLEHAPLRRIDIALSIEAFRCLKRDALAGDRDTLVLESFWH